MLRSFACAVALTMATGLAQATILTFDEIPGTEVPQTALDYQDYRFTSEHFHIPGSSRLFNPVTWNGTTHIGYEGGDYGHPITMTRTDGGAFSLVSLDLAEWFATTTLELQLNRPNAQLVDISAVHRDGSTSSFVLALDGIYDGMGGLVDFQHFSLPPAFNDLVSVVFTGLRLDGRAGGIALDNIQVIPTGVPEPGALGLLALGLGAASLARRRSAASRVASA